MTNYSKGVDAEARVLQDYKDRGFRLISKRFKTKLGEVDVIVENDDCVVFVEVKMRKTLDNAAFSLAPRQLQRILATAEIWASENECEKNMRFDVALATPYAIEIVENIIIGE
jgi:putative endonuclease